MAESDGLLTILQKSMKSLLTSNGFHTQQMSALLKHLCSFGGKPKMSSEQRRCDGSVSIRTRISEEKPQHLTLISCVAPACTHLGRSGSRSRFPPQKVHLCVDLASLHKAEALSGGEEEEEEERGRTDGRTDGSRASFLSLLARRFAAALSQPVFANYGMDDKTGTCLSERGGPVPKMFEGE